MCRTTKNLTNLRNRGGFSLLEVIITIGLLMTITIAVANMMKGSFDVRIALAENGTVNHRVSLAMQRIVDDLSHAYIVSTMDQVKAGNRTRGTIFAINPSAQADELKLTTFTKRPFVKNQKSSDQTFVIYRIEKDKKNLSWSHLHRGETAIIPERFNEIEQMPIIASYIKSLKILAWHGNDWEKFDWDSTKSAYKDRLPKMVKIILEAWAIEPENPEESVDADALPTVVVQTIVTLPYAESFQSVKESAKNWEYKLD